MNFDANEVALIQTALEYIIEFGYEFSEDDDSERQDMRTLLQKVVDSSSIIF
jgi:hypothetical protein